MLITTAVMASSLTLITVIKLYEVQFKLRRVLMISLRATFAFQMDPFYFYKHQQIECLCFKFSDDRFWWLSADTFRQYKIVCCQYIFSIPLCNYVRGIFILYNNL